MASLYCYEGDLPVKNLYTLNPTWFEERCKQVLENKDFLQHHAALWFEKFQKPSWVVMDRFTFFTTHGGSRLLVAYLRGDETIRARILCQYHKPPRGFTTYTPKVVHHKIFWEDYDSEFMSWAEENIEFKKGIIVNRNILVYRDNCLEYSGPKLKVTKEILEDVAHWNRDKVYWTHGDN